MVPDGDTIFCDSGSTTMELVRALAPRREVTIITNDYSIAAEAERLISGCTVILLGGKVRSGFHYTMGTPTVQMLSQLSAPIAFLAASAFSFDRGFTVHTLELATFKRTMIERSERQVLLLDASKIGMFTMATFAQLDDISAIITDKGIPEHDRRLIEEHDGGPELIMV